MSESAKSTLNNLDVSQIPNDDVDGLANAIEQYYKEDSPIKNQLSWNWDRNHLMLDGRQWLQFDNSGVSGGQWQKMQVSRANEYIPRPVTNYLYSNYQTLKSYLIKDKPRSKVFPNNPQDYKDKIAAQIGTLMCDANWEKLKEQYNYETAAANLLVYGTVFKKDYWDPSSVSMIKVPQMTLVPMTDPVTGQPIPGSEIERQVVDPVTGDPIYDELPLGDLNTTIVEPQRISLDPLAMHTHDAKWIMEASIQTLDWVKEVYGKEGRGYTGLAMEVKEEKDLPASMRRWYQLRTTSGVKSATGLGPSGAGGSGDMMVSNSAVIKEYYERPSTQYPRGRLIVVANGKTLYADESPYSGPEIGDWHPYSECRWEIVPGRFWGKSPFDDAVELQKRINSIDSVTVLTRKTSAIPQKLIPNNIGIAPGAWSGRPNQEIFYRSDGTGAKPEIIPPSSVDASVFNERAQCVADLKEIMGASDILKGQSPGGVEAASAISMLYEIGTGRLYPILQRWKQFIESSQKKQLRVINKFYKEPRPEYIRLIKAKNTDLADQDINLFLGTDLQDNCNVIIEAGAQVPKLQAALEAKLLQLAQLGLLNLQDPANRVQFQQDLGVKGYDADIEPDRKRAMWENDLLDNTLQQPANKPVVLAIDNHALHRREHQNRMKSPNFMALPSEVQQAYIMHDQQHEQFEQMQMQEMMLKQQATAPMGPSQAAPKGNPSPAKHDPIHSSGPGVVPKDTKLSLTQDVQVPAPIGG